MVAVEVRDLIVEYPEGGRVLDRFDLQVPDGESIVVAGPSGSGKTTLLRAIAGLVTPVGGDILFDGESMAGVPVRERDIAMVGSADGLYRHLDVERNLGFPLQMRGLDRQQREQRIRATSRVLRMAHILRRRPSTLSGGERQRAALGRATGRRPRVFLFDEPLAEIEPSERHRLTQDLRQVQQGMGVTTIFVTHDQRELMTLGDRLAIINAGRLQQVGHAMDLYRRPVNTTVASFVGDPPMAFVRADLDDSRQSLRVAGADIALPGDAAPALVQAPRTVLAGLRSEHLRVDAASGVRLPLHVRLVAPLGFAQLVTGDLAGRPASRVTATARGTARIREGDVVTVGIEPRHLHVFDAASGQSLYPTPLP